jgi:hypothetical protein
MFTIQNSTENCTANYIQSSKTRKIKCINIGREERISLFVDDIISE